MSVNRKQQGSSLVEVVVALFVLAIGMLGVMSMQVKSMQFSQSAYYYSQATYLANEILESMRSNRAAADTYLIELDESTPVASVNCSEAGKVCTPQQLRDYNLSEWRKNVEQTLVSGKASVQRSGDYYAITVQFDDSRAESEQAEPGAVLSEYVLVTEIR